MLPKTLILLTVLALASAWTPFYPQHPKYPTQAPISPQYKTSFSPLYANCGGGYGWRCRYTPFGILCGCLAERELAERWTTEGPKSENSSGLEISAEVQPGNTDTLVSLYQLLCVEGEFVGCVSTGPAFRCGCHDVGSGGDVDLDWDSDEGPDAWDGLGEEGARIKVGDRSVFPFSKVQPPHCTKGGMHLMCCPCGRKSCCFCAGFGERCPEGLSLRD